MTTNPFEAALGTFFEEANEMLVQIENSVLELEGKPLDVEELNALFRAAHTIKGSAGLFGLKAIVAFTHHVETVLDELRTGELRLDGSLSSLLFACRDHIAHLLALAKQGGNATAEDEARELALVQKLQALMMGAPPSNTSAPAQAAPSSISLLATTHDIWSVQITFGRETFRDGFDPLAMLIYLSTLGEIQQLHSRMAKDLVLNDWDDYLAFDPESCFLGFDIHLASQADKSTLESAFQFVLNDCELSIAPPASLTPTLVDKLSEPLAPERLGDLLLASGAVTSHELQTALAAQAESVAQGQAAPLGEILVAKHITTPAVVDAALARQQRHRDPPASEAKLVRVSADKLDQLINLVGELVIAGATSSSLAQTHRIPALTKNCKRINSLVEEIRSGALSMRMVPIGETFSRFRRVVRDVCTDLGKQVELVLQGSDAELDKSVVEKIVDPLMHIVRNALDHGIESPADREAAGKSPTGQLLLSARHDCGMVVIEVKDDGRGLNRDRILAKALERGLINAGDALADRDILQLVFAPGFSTAEAVTKLSGRGVGMDVVKRNIESLRGTVCLHSQWGVGTTVEIRLPLTLAIIDGFLVRVGDSQLVLPLDMVVECINPQQFAVAANSFEVDAKATGRMQLRGQTLPLIHLRQLFKLEGQSNSRASVVVVRVGDRRAGVVVDALLGEHQTVIKPLSRMFRRVRGVGGSTILGSGEVALILDVPVLLTLAAQIDAQQLPVSPAPAALGAELQPA
jgi:two-component system, chemotaxis family, sensor kinase CheA